MLEEAVEELARTIWLSPAVVAEVLRRAPSAPAVDDALRRRWKA
jgi:hypothetical protein